jgi:hypothetical protein
MSSRQTEPGRLVAALSPLETDAGAGQVSWLALPELSVKNGQRFQNTWTYRYTNRVILLANRIDCCE